MYWPLYVFPNVDWCLSVNFWSARNCGPKANALSWSKLLEIHRPVGPLRRQVPDWFAALPEAAANVPSSTGLDEAAAGVAAMSIRARGGGGARGGGRSGAPAFGSRDVRGPTRRMQVHGPAHSAPPAPPARPGVVSMVSASAGAQGGQAPRQMSIQRQQQVWYLFA